MNLRRTYKKTLIGLHRFRRNDNVILTLLAVAVGVVAAYGAIGFRLLIDQIQWLFYGNPADRLISAAAQLPWWQVLLAPAGGGLAVGLFIRYAMPERRPLSVADVIEATAERSGHLSLRSGLLAALASVGSIGCGASVGREGPVVHLGASIASWMARRLHLSRALMLTLVGCGVAAGVSSSFNAPLAGALFALEVVIGHYQLRAFAPVVISSVTGTVVSRLQFGDFPAFIKPDYEIASFWEFPAFALLGVASAVAALVLMHAVMFVADTTKKVPGPGWALPAYAGLIVGLIALQFPQVLGVGYEATDVALKGGYGLWLLIALIVAKTAATAVCLGSGFGGGIFSPSLVVGAMVGGAFGIVATMIFPDLSSGHGAYTLIGMGAVAASVLGAPISTILIVFELTGDYAITVAVMVAVVIASLITQQVAGQSFFRWQLERRGLNLGGDVATRLLRKTRVRELMDGDYLTVACTEKIDKVRRKLLKAPHGELFALDADGQLAGTIMFGDLHDAAFDFEHDDTTVAEDVVRRNPPLLQTDDTLEIAARLFSHTMDAHIPVVDSKDGMKMVGVVHQRDVMLAYQRAHIRAREIERGER